MVSIARRARARSPWSPRGQELVELSELAAEAAADELAQFEHGLIGDGVARARAVLRPADDARSVQDAQVLGHVLLRAAEHGRQFVDRGRPVSQRIEQLDAHGLANDTKAGRNHVNERIRERVRNIHKHNYTTEWLYSCSDGCSASSIQPTFRWGPVRPLPVGVLMLSQCDDE